MCRVVLPPGAEGQHAYPDPFRYVNVVMYGEFEAVLEIDNSRNVIDQIARFLARDVYSKIIVRDVVPKDGLPTTMDDYSITFVCNTHDSDPPRSTLDWIALYVPHVPERTLFGVVKAKILQNTLSNASLIYCFDVTAYR